MRNDFNVNYCAQAQNLVRGIAGDKWVEEACAALRDESSSTYIEANALRPIFPNAANARGSKNKAKDADDSDSDSDKKRRNKSKKSNKRSFHADDDDESCFRCCCKHTVCCLPWCFCPRLERSVYNRCSATARSIAKWVAIIIVIIWIITGINYLFTGESDLTGTINRGRNVFGYPPIDFAQTSIFGSASPHNASSTPPPNAGRVDL